MALRIGSWTERLAMLFGLLALLGAVGCGQTEQAQQAQSQTTADLVISNVTVIDGVNGIREGMSVALVGDEIVSVSPADTSAPQATQVIDGTGRFLIPGLWDMHVHVTYEPELTASMPELFLDYGITSVRDTGGMLPKLLPEIQRWRAVDAIAPRIYYSGPLLDGAKVVYDGNDRPEIGIANATVEQAEANFNRLVDAGVDFIKIYELVSPEVFAALAQSAAQKNLPIAAHVPLALLADEAGPKVGTMEHLRNVELACTNRADPLLAERRSIMADSGDLSGYALRSQLHAEFRPRALSDMDVTSPRCAEVLDSLQSTIQVPTLRLNTIVQYSPLLREDWISSLAKLPPQVAERWQQTAERFKDQPSAQGLQLAQWSLKLVAQMHKSGVPIGAGTDTPIGQAIPGYSLHTELERLVETGLTPLQAIHSATVRPAEFLNLTETHGQIQSGFVGDLVLLSADPSADIQNTRKIEAVISKGQRVR